MELVALAARVATPRAWKSTGIRPTACTASVWTGIPRGLASSASRATGWIAPVSLLASIKVANRVSARNASAMRSASASPSASTFGAVDGEPGRFQPRHRLGDRRVLDRAGDDVPRLCSAPASPKMARLLASVPPEVKITSAGSAPRIRADRLPGGFPAPTRGRPAECRLSALPAVRKYGRIASRTSGSSAVVALLSR